MKPDNLPETPNEQYDPNLEAQDEEVTSGGSNKLLYALVAGLLLLVVGYLVLPKGNGSAGPLSSATPSFMLDDAAVTATLPTAADSIAAGLKAAPAAAGADEKEAKATKADKAATKPAAPLPAAPGAAAPVAVVAAPAPAPVAAPEPVAAAPVAAPEPVAPANVTMAGKIEDENGRPMVGATVMLKGSNKVTSTDANGNYTLEVPAGDNTLVYGYGGYDDEVVRSRGTQPINVTLTPRAKANRKRR